MRLSSRGAWGFEAVRGVTAAFMIGTATMKLVSGHRAWYLLPDWAYWGFALVEVALAVGLYVCTVASAWSVVAISAGGIVTTLLFPHRPCGCFGASIVLDAKLHLMVAGTVAVCGLLVILWRPCAEEGKRFRQQLTSDT
jgi:hypothetical protein